MDVNNNKIYSLFQVHTSEGVRQLAAAKILAESGPNRLRISIFARI